MCLFPARTFICLLCAKAYTSTCLDFINPVFRDLYMIVSLFLKQNKIERIVISNLFSVGLHDIEDGEFAKLSKYIGENWRTVGQEAKLTRREILEIGSFCFLLSFIKVFFNIFQVIV